MNAVEAFELLTILDSQLLQTLAPELARYRPVVAEITAPISEEGCGACQKRAMFAKLAVIQTQLQDEINANPALLAQVPALLASVKMRKS